MTRDAVLGILDRWLTEAMAGEFNSTARRIVVMADVLKALVEEGMLDERGLVALQRMLKHADNADAMEAVLQRMAGFLSPTKGVH